MRVPFDERRVQGAPVTRAADGRGRTALANLGAKRAPRRRARQAERFTQERRLRLYLPSFVDYLGYLYNPLRAKNVPQIYCVYTTTTPRRLVPPPLSGCPSHIPPWWWLRSERARVFSGCNTKQTTFLSERLHDSLANTTFSQPHRERFALLDVWMCVRGTD